MLKRPPAPAGVLWGANRVGRDGHGRRLEARALRPDPHLHRVAGLDQDALLHRPSGGEVDLPMALRMRPALLHLDAQAPGRVEQAHDRMGGGRGADADDGAMDPDLQLRVGGLGASDARTGQDRQQQRKEPDQQRARRGGGARGMSRPGPPIDRNLGL